MSNQIIVAATGHRPNKIGGYDPQNPQRAWLKRQMRLLLEKLKPSYTISGMALGIDQDWALVSLNLGIPFLAAIPFLGQESNWPESSQREYKALLKQASQVVVVSPGAYAVEKMQIRNIFMVDTCTDLAAFWDGSRGGTGNCVRYAEGVGRRIHRIDPNQYRR